MSTLLSINPGGYFIYFAAMSAVVMLLSLVVYLALHTKKARRQAFQNWGTLSTKNSLLLILPLALLAFYAIYQQSFGHFFSLQSKQQQIEMLYHYPNTKIRLALSDIEEISVSSHIKRSGLQYRLIIHARDGQQYSSQLIAARDLKKLLPQLEKKLSVQIRL